MGSLLETSQDELSAFKPNLVCGVKTDIVEVNVHCVAV